LFNSLHRNSILQAAEARKSLEGIDRFRIAVLRQHHENQKAVTLRFPDAAMAVVASLHQQRGQTDWQPPELAGLDSSKPLLQLGRDHDQQLLLTYRVPGKVLPSVKSTASTAHSAEL